MPVGSIETTASRSTGFFCADAGQGQHALVEVVRPDPLPGEDGLFRRVLGGIRFLRSVSFLHGSGAGGQVRALRAAHRAVRIDTVRRAKGLTGTFRRRFRFAAVPSGCRVRSPTGQRCRDFPRNSRRSSSWTCGQFNSFVMQPLSSLHTWVQASAAFSPPSTGSIPSL